MISRKNRFHGHHSLGFLFKNGKSVRAESLSLKYIESKNEDYRLSVIVSKKVHKSAVVRNRIRRRIYEIVRKEKLSNPKASWRYDMAIFVYDDSLASISADDLNKRVCSLLSKVIR